MSSRRIIVFSKTVTGTQVEPRGAQGPTGHTNSPGPIGISYQGVEGDIGTPGPTCACSLAEHVNDVVATGASDRDFLSYSNSKFTPSSQVNVNQIDFNNIPTFDDATAAFEGLNDIFKLWRRTNENLIRMTYRQMTMFSRWTTNLSGGVTNNDQIRLPLVTNGAYNFKVYWGDGTSDIITSENDPARTHTYPAEGTYDVKITGQFHGFRFGKNFNGNEDHTKIINISQWGTGFRPNSSTSSQGYNFNGCFNLKITATDMLDLTDTTNFERVFQRCNNLTGIPGIGNWDVSQTTTLSFCFSDCYNFDDDISNWDVSNVSFMDHTFTSCNQFNNGGSDGIRNWNTESLTDMRATFRFNYKFNQPLDGWNVSKVSRFVYTFREATIFDQDLSNWGPTGATNFQGLYGMFENASAFNNGGSTGINNWNTSNVVNMFTLFNNATSFNQDISNWDVSSCTDFASMFNNAESFNNGGNVGPSGINQWAINTTLPVNMNSMFSNTEAFNCYLGDWNISAVTNMASMFNEANLFNNNGGSLNNWNPSQVTSFADTFRGADVFSAPMKDWNVSSCTNFGRMFQQSNFNQDVSGWTFGTTNPINMTYMFVITPFNNGDTGGINNWNTSAVTNMFGMFQSTPFNQDISSWGITALNPNTTSLGDFMLNNTTFSTENYDALLISWEQQVTEHGGPTGLVANFGNSTYTVAATRNTLITTHQWTITDGGPDPQARFISTWDTTITSGSETDNQTVKLPIITNGEYNMFVDWGDTGATAGHGETGNFIDTDQDGLTYTYSKPGTYTITVEGRCRGFRFNNTGDRTKITNIEQWGSGFALNTASTTQNGNFYGCSNLNFSAVDAPDLTETTNLSTCFRGASSLNASLSNWDVSNVTNLSIMFYQATVFNNGGDTGIGNWDVSNVVDISNMFAFSDFNQPIGNWNTGKIRALGGTFYDCPFNQDISNWNTSEVTSTLAMFQFNTDFNNGGSTGINNWNVSKVTEMRLMFSGASSFNQPIGNWGITGLNRFANPLTNFMNGANAFSTENYDALLISWEAQVANDGGPTGINAHFGDAIASPTGPANTARDALVNIHEWTIIDGGTGP